MKINKTKKIKERLFKYISAHAINNAYEKNMLIPVLYGQYDIMSHETFANELKENRDDICKYCDIKEAIAKTALDPLFINSEIFMRDIDEEIVRHFKVFEKNHFYENPYLKNIKINNVKVGNLELTTLDKKPYELFVYNYVELYKRKYRMYNFGIFMDTVSFPVILKNDKPFLSLFVDDINLTESHIKKAKGNLLVLGCGFNYYAYMTSLKEEVENITIVEEDEDIIKLFTDHILPQFKNKDKIHIIRANIFEFMNTLEDGSFDQCYVDACDFNTGIISYIKLKKNGKRFKKMQMQFLNEENTLISIRSYIFVEMYDTLNETKENETDKYNDPIYILLKDFLDQITINYANDIDRYLELKNIAKLMNNI